MENRRITSLLLFSALCGVCLCQNKVSLVNPLCLFASQVVESNLNFVLYNHLQPDGKTFKMKELIAAEENVVIVQGFLESDFTSPWLRQMIDAYLALYNKVNVIHLDWSYYSQQKFLTATCSAPEVGKILGQFIARIAQRKGLDLQTFHIVGFSLGGQLSGFAGQEVLNVTGKKIGRITGLDVVGVGFEFPVNKPANERLSEDDALDVVGIHTNFRVNGIRSPFGRVDFYINGGAFQPSCKQINPSLNLLELIRIIFCSHLKATEIFIRALKKEKFVGLYCPSLKQSDCLESNRVLIEDKVDPDALGIYYVATNV